jgi:hypothetical protein
MLNVSKRCNPRPKARDALLTWATHSTARNALACLAFVPAEEVQERLSNTCALMAASTFYMIPRPVRKFTSRKTSGNASAPYAPCRSSVSGATKRLL